MPAEIPAPRFDLTFEATSHDLESLYRWSNFESGAGLEALKKYRRMVHERVGIALFASIGIAWLIFGGVLTDDPKALLTRFALLTVAILFWNYVYRFARAASRPIFEKQLRDALSRPQAIYHQGATRVVLGENEFLVRRTHEDVLQRWSGISRVDRARDLVLLVRPDDRIFFIPLRAFASPEASSSFFEFATEAAARAPESDAQTLQRYSEAHEAHCPACDYSLTGSRATRCPECAHPLDRSTLPAAWQLPEARA